MISSILTSSTPQTVLDGKSSTKRIRSLDGLRAISISFVILGHIAGTKRCFGQSYVTGHTAALGVDIFFVISGFLITSLLMKEFVKTGRISLKGFYIRRALRIFPAFYLFLMIQALLVHLDVVHIEPWEFLTAMTYTANSVVGAHWNLGHIWSLSVEEQFYLLWPAALSLTGLKGGARWALGAVLVAPLLRSLNYFQHWPVNDGIFPLRADFLAIGCLLALTRERLHANAIYHRLLSSRWFFLVPTAAYLMRIYPGGRTLAFLLSLGNVCLALTVDWTIINSEGAIGRFLNAKPLVYIGTLSYSIYLWQQFFVDRYGKLGLNTFPWNLLATLICAALSYHLVELPFLRLKDRFHSKADGVKRTLACAE